MRRAYSTTLPSPQESNKIKQNKMTHLFYTTFTDCASFPIWPKVFSCELHHFTQLSIFVHSVKDKNNTQTILHVAESSCFYHPLLKPLHRWHVILHLGCVALGQDHQRKQRYTQHYGTCDSKPYSRQCMYCRSTIYGWLGFNGILSMQVAAVDARESLKFISKALPTNNHICVIRTIRHVSSCGLQDFAKILLKWKQNESVRKWCNTIGSHF